MPRSRRMRMVSSPPRRPMSGSPQTAAAVSAMRMTSSEENHERGSARRPARSLPTSASMPATASGPMTRRTYDTTDLGIDPWTCRAGMARPEPSVNAMFMGRTIRCST